MAGSEQPGAATGGHGRAHDPGAEPHAPEQAWEQAAEAGIHVLRIPTPFAVGRVNCYLIEDEPLTLIDTGPNSGKALDELERGLARLGRSLEELELIFVTHQHIDHVGLVEIAATRSGAEVAAIEPLVGFLGAYSEQAELDDEFAAELMLRHGIEPDVVVALRSVSRSFRAWGAGATVTRPLRDGELLELRDRRLEVQLRPGHSPTDTLLWDTERELLIGADHLLAKISSNPLLSRPLDGPGKRPRALLTYIASLRRTRELPARIVLPGHGDPVTDHAGLIDSRFAMHERRARRLLTMIDDRPRTAHSLAQELWGNVAVTQAYLTLSEVIGHLDLLIDRGLAEELDDGEVIHFAATG